MGTFSFFLPSLFSVFKIEQEISQLQTKINCDIPSDVYLFQRFCFCWHDLPSVYTHRFSVVTLVTVENLSVAPGWVGGLRFYNLKLLCEIVFSLSLSGSLLCVFEKKEKVQKRRWLDAAAGSKLATEKIWETCVCLFHKAFISCFISSSTCGSPPAGLMVLILTAEIMPLESLSHTHTHTPNG